jgi:major vault protein
MGDNDRGRERDLVLAPNEFAFISDETKGNINVYVGPHKTSLANTDRPVVFNGDSKRFDRCSLEQATQTLAVAPEGWYLVLKNPARDGSHPRTGALNNLPDLNVGRKVNVPGPVSFALWPGQMVRVIQGHHLHSNQYLVVRVYDEEAARANWKDAVFKPQRTGDGAPEPEEPPIRQDDLTMGKLMVIKGTEVAFHIPPTGIEVVADAAGNYVREAVTLERLEYCILLDEDGNKRFIRGPAVVFPRPTEGFVERGGARKFRAIELSETSGIYVKVIAPYEDDGGAHKVGEELFLTGKEQMIYFPRPEHAVVKYGEHEIHYAIAIPAGEGRYVLDRRSGSISLKRGPAIFLPDPRHEVIVRRVLPPRTVALWFPGNADALAVNQQLATMKESQGEGKHLVDRLQQSNIAARGASADEAVAEKVGRAFAGDDFNRSQTFTRPRTVVLDTKYEGAVSIDVWTGYAVMVVSRSGERKVIDGPHTHLMAYDETLQSLELSSGTPKSDERLIRTVYLRTLNNKVSDAVEAETRDLCKVRLLLSYRVNFEGDSARWFNVENYVKFLCDHLRSLLRHAVKQHGVEDFYARAAAVVRDVILGAATADGKRPGRSFDENGMRVYDVEVLDVSLGDEVIAKMLVEAQHAAVSGALHVATEQRKLEMVRHSEETKLRVNELQAASRLAQIDARLREVERQRELSAAEAAAESALDRQRQESRREVQALLDAVHTAELARKRAESDLESERERQRLERDLTRLAAEVRATVERAGAVSPDLVAALQSFSDRALAERMAESMAPLAILGGESVSEVLGRLLQGTPAARALAKKP